MSIHSDNQHSAVTVYSGGPEAPLYPLGCGATDVIEQCYTEPSHSQSAKESESSRFVGEWEWRAKTAEAQVVLLVFAAIGLRQELADRRQKDLQASWAVGHWKSLFQQTRTKLMALRRQVKRQAPAQRLEKELRHLKALLQDAGVDARKRSTNTRLRMQNSELRTLYKASQQRVGELEAALARLRSTKQQLEKSQYGPRSEQQRVATGRHRGGQPGAPGHRRTQRPALARQEETLAPSVAALTCPDCGMSYAANGAHHHTEITEIKVKAYVRLIKRPRFRRVCQCPGVPSEMAAAPPPRLFPHTAYGVSVWHYLLYGLFVELRSLRSIARSLSDYGLPISAGTLGDSIGRLTRLFAPVSAAILVRQNEASVLHGDETSWRVQAWHEGGKSKRSWLWIGLSPDTVLLHIDAHRNLDAALAVFRHIADGSILVCDRYATYDALARWQDARGKRLRLAFCWVHVRRDFLKPAAGDAAFEAWRQQWIKRFAELFHVNKERRQSHAPDRVLTAQSAAFNTAHCRLQQAVDDVFTIAEAELAACPPDAAQAKPLRSLLNHRTGLTVFVDHPQVPMDNNLAERGLRPAVIKRKISGGSFSAAGAELTAQILSLSRTLELHQIPVRHWLQDYLQHCAEQGGQPPDNLAPWLPWSMRPDRLAALRQPP